MPFQPKLSLVNLYTRIAAKPLGKKWSVSCATNYAGIFISGIWMWDAWPIFWPRLCILSWEERLIRGTAVAILCHWNMWFMDENLSFILNAVFAMSYVDFVKRSKLFHLTQGIGCYCFPHIGMLYQTKESSKTSIGMYSPPSINVTSI